MRSDQIIPLIQPNSVYYIDMSDNANAVMASFTLLATFRTSKQLIFVTAAAQPAGAAAAADDALPTADGNVGGVTRSEATAEEQRQRRRRWN